jgi:hypothetical protein
MPRRESEGGRIIQFFTNEPLDKVRFVFEMVRDVVKARVHALEPAQAAKRPAPKRKAPLKSMPQATPEQRAATGPATD